MATNLQRRLASEIVQNAKRKKPLNKKQLLVSVGYSPSTASVKQREIIEQKGVQAELKALGFDPHTAKRVVGEILTKSKRENMKLRAADMVFKVHGTYAPEKSVVGVYPLRNLPDDELRRIASGGEPGTRKTRART